MINFRQLQEQAHEAGEQAPAGPVHVRIILPAGDNFTRWVKREGFNNIRPAGYAMAYIKVLRVAGVLAQIERY